MEAVRRCFGLFHVAIAAAVAVQALASETYDAELSSAVWLVLNWLMAVAVVTAGAFSYMRWRGRDQLRCRQLDLPARAADRVRRVACPLFRAVVFGVRHRHRGAVVVPPLDVAVHRHAVRARERHRRCAPPARTIGALLGGRLNLTQGPLRSRSTSRQTSVLGFEHGGGSRCRCGVRRVPWGPPPDVATPRRPTGGSRHDPVTSAACSNSAGFNMGTPP